MIWRNAKAVNTSPFYGSPSDWDTNKQRLVYWSSLYDSVYNSVDRPPQWVIEDDELLDKWLEEEMEEFEERAEKEYKSKRGTGKSARSAWEHEEVVSIDRTLGRYNPRPPKRGQ